MLRTVPAAEQEAWMNRYCTGQPLGLWEIALDGLTRSEVRRTSLVVLSPGERLDALAYFPAAGRYCAIHTPFEPVGPMGNGRAVAPRRTLAIVRAEGSGGTADPESALRAGLIRAAERALAGVAHASMRQRVIADLQKGLRLSVFVPHRTIQTSELTGRRPPCSTTSHRPPRSPRSGLTSECTITSGLIACCRLAASKNGESARKRARWSTTSFTSMSTRSRSCRSKTLMAWTSSTPEARDTILTMRA